MARFRAETKDRSCLVCGGTTTVAHMGLDVCRACTVFYRRSAGKVYACRSNSNECHIGLDGVKCRKCRFDSIARVAKEAGALNLEKSSESGHSQGNDQPSCSRKHFENSKSELSLSAQNHRPILARMSTSYNTMCEIRLISELNLRPVPPHPMQMKHRERHLYPATFASMNTANRVFLSAVIPFASSSFPEFDQLPDDEQWTIIKNFLFRFRLFEGTYRANKIFPERMDRTLVGYTTYMTGENADNYYSDCPNTNSNLEDAKRLMMQMSKTVWVNNREFVARLKPDHDEFLAITGIMFWTLDDLSVSEKAIQLSERYRTDILQELHVYYRDELAMNDYASRLGELLTLVHFFEKCDAMREFFELLRLMNIFSDDTLAYRLIKE